MTSTLNPENIQRPDRELSKGHGTGALGPSDTSDTGSDVQGGIGLDNQEEFILDSGTTSDPDRRMSAHSAGPDVGDANLDSDSDATGTGERATAGRDTLYSPGRDIDTDRIEYVTPEDFEHDETDGNAEPDRSPGEHPHSRH